MKHPQGTKGHSQVLEDSQIPGEGSGVLQPGLAALGWNLWQRQILMCCSSGAHSVRESQNSCLEAGREKPEFCSSPAKRIPCGQLQPFHQTRSERHLKYLPLFFLTGNCPSLWPHITPTVTLLPHSGDRMLCHLLYWFQVHQFLFPNISVVV